MVHKTQKNIQYELWNDKMPNVIFFHTFGGKCFVQNNRKNYLKTFDERAYEGMLLGYSSTSKVFRILSKRTMVIEESIHVVFDEPNV